MPFTHDFRAPVYLPAYAYATNVSTISRTHVLSSAHQACRPYDRSEHGKKTGHLLKARSSRATVSFAKPRFTNAVPAPALKAGPKGLGFRIWGLVGCSAPNMLGHPSAKGKVFFVAGRRPSRLASCRQMQGLKMPVLHAFGIHRGRLRAILMG